MIICISCCLNSITSNKKNYKIIKKAKEKKSCDDWDKNVKKAKKCAVFFMFLVCLTEFDSDDWFSGKCLTLYELCMFKKNSFFSFHICRHTETVLNRKLRFVFHSVLLTINRLPDTECLFYFVLFVKIYTYSHIIYMIIFNIFLRWNILFLLWVSFFVAIRSALVSVTAGTIH